MHISVSREMEKKLELPSLPRDVKFTGLLVIGVLREEYVDKLRAFEKPMITVDQVYAAPGVKSVTSLNLQGALTAVRHLIDAGHRKIGFIGPVGTAVSVYERWCGYVMAMSRAKLSVDERFSILGDFGGFRLFDTPEALDPYFKTMRHLPTAFFCGGDRIAIALIHVLSTSGVRVPEDVSVVGFDDIAASRLIIPKLTTVRIDRKLMGRIAVSLLDGEDEGALNYRIGGELVIRDSVREIPAKRR